MNQTKSVDRFLQSKLGALAYTVAKDAHKGQTRWDGKSDYFEAHVLPVALAAYEGYGTLEGVVGLLHDVIEDTDLTEASLASHGFPNEIIESVVALSKLPGERYDAYLARVMGDTLAQRVKIYDVEANLADLDGQYPGQHKQRKDKYRVTLMLLRSLAGTRRER